jgi:T5SS/PEP-CTERM-associated repeat protein
MRNSAPQLITARTGSSPVNMKAERHHILRLRRRPLVVAVATVLALGVTAPIGQAATRTWDGGGGTENWSNENNWNGNTDIALNGTDSIVFAASGANRLTTGVQNLVGLSILGLSYNTNAGASVIGGSQPLTILGGGITNSAGFIQTLNMPVIVGASQAWSSSVVLGGGISFAQGTSAFTLTGGFISKGDINNTTTHRHILNQQITVAADQTWNGNSAGLYFTNLIKVDSAKLTTQSVTVDNDGLANVIGDTGAATWNLQAGSSMVNGTTTLGKSANSSGTINISGTGALWRTGTLELSGAGTGTATVSAGGTMTVGKITHGGGTSTLTIGEGGTVTVSGDITHGGGASLLKIDAGGTLTLNGKFLDGSGVATLMIDGGTLNLNGSVINAHTFVLGHASGSTGQFSLSGAKVLSASESIIGDAGIGIFNQSGTSQHSVQTLSLGKSAGGSGTYNLLGGTLGASSIVNNAGTGILNVDGGTLSTTTVEVDYLNVGNAASTIGTYTLSVSKTLTSTETVVGGAGSGTFHQSGIGLHSTTTLTLGKSASGAGTYNLGGGRVMVTGNFAFGPGSGIFNLSGGDLSVGSSSGTGTFNWTSGTLSITGIAGASLGSGLLPASLTLQAGKILTVTGPLTIDSGNSLTLAGGSLTTGGITGDGTLNIAGGTFSLTGTDITVGSFNVGSAAQGSFVLASGKALTTANIAVGGAANGTFTQSGGTHTTAALTLGSTAGRNGTFAINGGQTIVSGDVTFGPGNGVLNLNGGSLSVGSVSGTGTFNWTAGTFSITSIAGASLGSGLLPASLTLLAGRTLNVTGPLTIDNGKSLTLNGGSLTTGGITGAGILNIDGGTFALTGTDIIANSFNVGSAAQGSFVLASGKALTTASTVVGGAANGTFTQSGGTHTTAALTLGSTAGRNGIYAINGGQTIVSGDVTFGPGNGVLNLNGGSLSVGSTSGTGTFNWTAGTLSITGIAGASLGSGLLPSSLTLQTGKTLNVTGDLTIDGGKTLNIAGGALSADSIVNGAGPGDLRLNGGSLNFARVLNVNNFHVASANDSDSTFTLTNGRSINLATLSMAEGFGSKATFRLAGGSLTTEATMIAMNGLGIFEQTGGSHIVMSLRSGLPDQQRTGGTYHLQGGTLNVGAIGNSYPGYGNPNLYINGGTLNLAAGGVINVDTLSIGDMQGRTSSLAIGTQQILGSDELRLGGSGTGNLTISGGGSAFTTRAYIFGGGSLTVTGSDPLSGAGSSMNLSNFLQISGSANVEALKIENGGTVQLYRVLLYSGTVNVTGANTLLGTGTLEVGWGNGAAANVSAGATVYSTGETWIGINGGLSGALSVTGSGSTLASGRAIVLGVTGGTGTLVIGDGGLASSDQGVQIGYVSKVSLGTGGRLLAPSVENAGRIEFTGGTASLEANVVSTYGSRILATGNSNAVVKGAVDVLDHAEVQIAQGSKITFTGMVNQRNGAVFSGTGDKVYAGGFAVGNSPGLGRDAGSVTFASTNVYEAEIAGTAPGNAQGAGLMFDRYVVAGKLTFGGTLKVVQLNGYVPQAGQSFDLFDWGTSDGQFADFNFTGAPLAGGLAWDTSRLYTDGTLTVAAVPEPSGYIMMLAGMGLMGFMIRRRRAAPSA